MIDTLRDELTRRSIPDKAVILPGDEPGAMEGALRIREDGASGWLLETLDYGRAFRLGSAESEDAAAKLLLAYLDRPLPPLSLFATAEVEAAAAAAAPEFDELRTGAAEETLLVELPAGVLVDRIGAIDGTMFFPYGTPYEQRSLPPLEALPEGSERRSFVTRDTVLVHVEVAEPWFGQPGGGLRFILAEDSTGIRDLLVSGALERFRTED